MTRRIVLLGGGHAHLQVLQALRREPLRQAEVVLVTPHPRLVYSGMVPGAVAGHFTVDEASIALGPLARAAGVELVEGRAVALDAAARELTLADGRVAAYDLLSLDIGAQMDRDRLPGAREQALFVRPLEPFVQWLPRLLALAAARPLDIVVVGAGAAGFELAMALQHRLGRGGGDGGARVALVTGGPEPLSGYPPRLQALARRELARARITVFREACTAVEPGAVVLASGARLACDAPLLATGAEAPRWLQGSGLALDEAGFVRTGPTLQSVSHPEVLAAGDCASREGAVLPRSGVMAVRAGPALAHNLRQLAGGAAPAPWQPPRRTLNLLSCGGRRALLAWGGVAVAGGWVWWWKRHIDRAFIARQAVDDRSGGAPRAEPVTRSDGR